jgi:hypothetical protein
LKSSLIDPARVKAFVDQQEREKAQQREMHGGGRQREKPKERLKTKITT